MIANTPSSELAGKSSEHLFPLEYYANVQATIDSTLAMADGQYDLETIDEVFGMLKHFLNLDYGRLYVYDFDKHELFARHGLTLNLNALTNGKYSLGEGVTGQAFLERQALYVKDIAHSSLYLGRSMKAAELPYRMPAYLAVPFYGEHVCGVLGFHLNERSEFDVISTMAIISSIADWIANESMTFMDLAA